MRRDFGVVVIGRNEGRRLVRCLRSLAGHPVVYVDSGSTDGSVGRSQMLGAHVVELDMSLPFTAARARNAGAAYLVEKFPDVEFIQFVDGDCQIESGWLEAAADHLRTHTELAVVCGRRRELRPESSIYNLFCDIEWDTPVGRAKACGGDAMYRTRAFKAVGGFNELFTAGEEPELCFRLRQAGWAIARLDRNMTRHDADMHRFGQWWKRSQRCGYAYALGAWEHGGSEESYNVRACLSTLFWGGGVPLIAVGLVALEWRLGLAFLIAAYLYLGLRIYRASRKAHPAFSSRQLLFYTGFLVLQKFPELVGVARCSFQHLLGRRTTLIEYK